MATTRGVLERIGGNLAESMGVRERELRPQLSPVPNPRDIGRRPVRNVGLVEIDQVMPDPDQPRVEFEQDALDRLADSIREKGQLSPIRVRWSELYLKWVIISGERRWRATRLAGLPEIECHFHETELSRSEILEEQLVENLLREALQPIEEAKAYSQLIDLNGWTGKELANAIRVNPSKITRALALLKLPSDVQEQISRGALSARSGYETSRIADDGMRRGLAARAATGELTHLQAANVARQRKGKRKTERNGTNYLFRTDDGWKVTVTSNRRDGTGLEAEKALLVALQIVRSADEAQTFKSSREEAEAECEKNS